GDSEGEPPAVHFRKPSSHRDFHPEGRGRLVLDEHLRANGTLAFLQVRFDALDGRLFAKAHKPRGRQDRDARLVKLGRGDVRGHLALEYPFYPRCHRFHNHSPPIPSTPLPRINPARGDSAPSRSAVLPRHSPMKRGGRFSWNARTPSWKSL